jgi:hypothetical protein
MLTTAEILSVDGVNLNTLAYNVDSLTGRLRTAALRGDNVLVPSRHGSIYTTTKVYDEGSLVFPMWVRGCNEDGDIPSDTTTRKLFYKNLDKLTALFSYKRRLLDIRHTLPDGSVRQCFAEVTDAIDFSTDSYNPLGKFSVVMKVPSPFFQDVAAVSDVHQIVNNGIISLSNFVGATAPMEDLKFTILGPVTNFKMFALEGGVSVTPELSFQYQAAIADGKSLIVDCSNWSLSQTGGLTIDYTKVVHKGSSRYMVVTPDTTPQLKVTGSSLSVDPTKSLLTVAGRRKFLIG